MADRSKPLAGRRLAEHPLTAHNNFNALIRQHRDRLLLSSSSTWGGWIPAQAVDGQHTTSWFSETGDSVANKRAPWIEVTFPEDVTLSHVTILGNRDPVWRHGYGIHAGLVTLKDASGNTLHVVEGDGTGEAKDHDFQLADPVAGVRTIRFASLDDRALENDYQDVGVAEILVE